MPRRNRWDRRDGPEHDPNVPRVGEDPNAPSRSRTSLKNERVQNEKALARLVEELVALDEKRWSQLGVGEQTVDALLDAQKVKSPTARARQLRKVRATLRDWDWVLLRRQLDDLRAGYSMSDAQREEHLSKEARDWSERLLIAGPSALTRFLDDYPSADRQRIRQLIKQAKQAPDAKRAKARLQLDRAVQHEVTTALHDSTTALHDSVHDHPRDESPGAHHRLNDD